MRAYIYIYVYIYMLVGLSWESGNLEHWVVEC